MAKGQDILNDLDQVMRYNSVVMEELSECIEKFSDTSPYIKAGYALQLLKEAEKQVKEAQSELAIHYIKTEQL